jgi:hypothetical protein
LLLKLEGRPKFAAAIEQQTEASLLVSVLVVLVFAVLQPKAIALQYK